MLRVTGRDQINRFVNVCYIQLCNFVKNCHRPSTFIGAPFISNGDVVLLDFPFESQRDIVARPPPRHPPLSSLRPISQHVETRPTFFPSEFSQQVRGNGSKSRVYLSQFLSLSLSFPNVNKPWIFPSSSSAVRSIFNRPFPLHPHSSSYIFITRIISESKMFSRRIEWAAASAFSYTPVRVMFDGGREGRATRNQFQRNTLPTLLVVFMTDGCNGELIPWQSGGRHYTTE